jgi:energy-coupling factor transporter ATP-binding protein EcfA2
VVVGSIVAAVTGHALIVLFGATAFVAAVLAWGSMVLVHRRRSRLWRNEMRRRRHRRASHHVATLEWLAERERRRHPSVESLVAMIGRGDPYMWSRRPADDDRSIWDVEIRRRDVDHEVDDHLHTCRDVPETVSLGPGVIVGVHGVNAVDVVKALVLRLAASVGPSDLDVVGTSSADELAVPHWRGSVDRLSIDDTEVHAVIVCTEPNEVASRTSIARRLVAAERAALVVAADRRDRLPHNCNAVIVAGDDAPTPQVLDSLAKALSTWSDPDLVGSDVPSIVWWNEMYGEGEIASRWGAPSDRCRVRLGAAADGRVDLDLVRDGPHMVVVGTTGSGKSEFLRTLVLGLAADNPPDRVQFALIDFKGGAAFDAVRGLPHVIDVITDLDRDSATDEEAGQRVVDGLRAELVRREHVLRQHGVSSLTELVPSRAGDADREGDVPPRLVIVIDELARLQADVPAFVAALVDLAQRGRSLGVHLVVGTQTPGRVVSSEVLANSDIRVALRLNVAGDSAEIVGTPIAARLPRSTPGRAVLRLANDEPVIFQVASTEGVLADAVDSIAVEARLRGVTSPRPIWCPTLPTVIPADTVELDAIGVVDDRRHQSQPGFRWDATSNVLVVGGRGSGTTTAVMTLADRWHMRHRTDVEPVPLIVWFEGRHIDDLEMVDRMVHVIETARQRPALVVVEDLDLWSDRQANSRHHVRLWERFIAVISRPDVTLVASCTRDPMGVSRLGERFDHVLVMRGEGPVIPGRCRVDKTLGSTPIGTTMQWVLPPDPPRFEVCRPRRLPLVVNDAGDQAFAVQATDLEPIVLHDDVPTVFLMIGPRGSGRTTALHRWAEVWTACHPDGVVHRIGSVDDWYAAVNDTSASGLLVIDDMPSLWSRLTTHDVNDALTRGHHLVAAVTPAVLRARPEHPLHDLRRRRTGLILGSSAHDDVELFGVFDLDLSFVEPAPGRGWFVDRGEVVDLVQVVLPSEGAS